MYRSALHYSILLSLTGYSYRKLAMRIPDSALFQWFTGSAQMHGICPASKSRIERFEKMIPTDAITELVHELNRAVTDKDKHAKLLRREATLKMDQIFADTSCVKSNIHVPVDWVLLRDATRTLTKAIIVIRKYGLKHRIRNPKYFMREMNKLCIEMSNVRKKQNAPKKRKVILRCMKKLMKIVKSHAKNYHQLLEAHWSETTLTVAETQDVLDMKIFSTNFLRLLSRLTNVLSEIAEWLIKTRYSVFTKQIHT